MQSAVFKKLRTNCSQNDSDDLMYFHVVLVESVTVVVAVVSFCLFVCLFFSFKVRLAVMFGLPVYSLSQSLQGIE